MNKRSILTKLENALDSLGDVKTNVKFEDDDIVRIEIISNIFKNVIITKRIDMVSNAIRDISRTDLIVFNISILALTEDEDRNEKKKIISINNDDFEEIVVEVANSTEPNEYLKAAGSRFKEHFSK